MARTPEREQAEAAGVAQDDRAMHPTQRWLRALAALQPQEEVSPSGMAKFNALMNGTPMPHPGIPDHERGNDQ